MAKRTAIGIDLGTTNSCVGVFQHGKIEIITNDQGNRTTPSYVAFTVTERLVGDAAKSQMVMNPDNTVFDTKRLIGKTFDDHNVQVDMKNWPFKVINENSKPKIQVEYQGGVKTLYPEEISSMVLKKMKETAEGYLGTTVTDAVITVPVYFNDFQCQAIKDAGTLSGLNVLRILNEPIAAAIAYGLDKKLNGKRNILTFDLGGGTFDVSIVTIENDDFEVKTTSANLGGKNFDNRIVNHFIQEFKHKYKKDPTNNKRALLRLQFACERVKQALSSSFQASIAIDSLFEGIDFHSSITRARFEELCADLFLLTLEVVEKALQSAKIDKAQIDDIVLVGGCTRIPKIQNLLQDFFNGKELNKSIPPDEVVAYGAATVADKLCYNICETVHNLMILHDVTPLSLGIEKKGGEFEVIINRNTTIPTTQTKNYHTSEYQIEEVLIKVYQGERPIAKDNQLLGVITLTGGIPPAPRGVYNFDVTFDIDEHGILRVSVMETTTGKFDTLTIINKYCGCLTEAKIENMILEAETFQDEDRKKRVRIAAKNVLDYIYFNTKSTVKQPKIKNKVSEEVRNKVANVCNKTIKLLDEREKVVAEKEKLEQEIKQEIEQIFPKTLKWLNENFPKTMKRLSENQLTEKEDLKEELKQKIKQEIEQQILPQLYN